MDNTTIKNAFDSAQTLKLKKNEVHLWITRPTEITDTTGNFDQGLFHQYQQLLSENEAVKTARYKFAKDRHSALITRAFVRDLLSKYTGMAPAKLTFDKGGKGKPELSNVNIPLRFNLSHTDNLIICAVTLDDDIGCDVENTKRNNDVLKIADRYFSTKETEALFSMPVAEQRSRFFDYWTLKEAYIKAWGLGLAIPLKDFSFELTNAAQYLHSFCPMLNNIGISFAPRREDTPSVWQHWLLYPNDEHRIAISLRRLNQDKLPFNNLPTKKQSKQGETHFRYFESVPLLGFNELPNLS